MRWEGKDQLTEKRKKIHGQDTGYDDILDFYLTSGFLTRREVPLTYDGKGGDLEGTVVNFWRHQSDRTFKE